MNRNNIFELINRERDRQDVKHPNQDEFLFHRIGLGILGEEVGEVNKAWLEGDMENLKEELVQVAAVAVRWLELLR